MLRVPAAFLLCLAAVSATFAQATQAKPPNNIILFVPDGMRASKVSPELTPAMAAVRDQGFSWLCLHRECENEQQRDHQ